MPDNSDSEVSNPASTPDEAGAAAAASPPSGVVKRSGPLDKRTLLWVNSTYFAEGLPYMIVRILSGAFFTQIGAKERYIGYLNYLGLPWNLKFLWAPLLDGWGRKKYWQVGTQAVIGVLTFLIGAVAYLAADQPDATPHLLLIALLFLAMAFVAATNDIAIDSYYLEALPRREDQALFSGYRVLAYRLSMIFARSGLVALVALVVSYGGYQPTDLPYRPWAYSFFAGGAVMVLMAVLHLSILPIPAQSADADDLARAGKTQMERAKEVFSRGFATYLQQPQVGTVLAFIILYKMGDEILFSMATPFLMRELHISTAQYAWIGGIVGAAGSVVGAMGGGYWINKVGLRRAMWPLTLLMNLNIWLYVWLASTKPDPSTLMGISVIAGVHGFEQIAAGLGSAVLLMFLLTTCAAEYKATHYAIGSAIMSIPGTLVGGQAGVWVEQIGYTNLFIIAFFSSIPGMLLIPKVPIRT